MRTKSLTSLLLMPIVLTSVPFVLTPVGVSDSRQPHFLQEQTDQNPPGPGSPVPGGPREKADKLRDQLTDVYGLTKLNADSSGASSTDAGTVLVVQKEGILAFPPSQVIAGETTFKNGEIQHAYVGQVFLGKHTRNFPVNDKVQVTGITLDAKEDKVVLLLAECAACNGNDQEYRARVAFQFPSGYLATADVDQIADVISQVLDNETLDAAPVSSPEATDTESHGGTTYTAKNGTEFRTGKAGNLVSLKTRSGTEARFGANGKVVSIRSGGFTIRYGARGSRMVETLIAYRRHVVSYGEHRGFVERMFPRGDGLYMRRTHLVNGRSYAVMYRCFPYRGAWYCVYMPGYYYAPGFYGWAYNPWAAPVTYAWGWAGDPWYRFYGGYFAPYPAYADASLWLTDYALAENLQAAYQAQLDGNGGNPPPPADSTHASGGAAAPQTATGITPEVKAAIDEEVKAQLAAEKAAAAQRNATPPTDQPPPALDSSLRTFIVSTVLSETLPDGTSCSLSTGDILTRISTDPDANQNVKVLVTSSQSGDCSSGAQVAVSVQDLQDMHNNFAAKIDAGLQKLAHNQGNDGIPTGPAAGRQANPDAQAQPDLTAMAELQQLQQAADQAEAEVKEALRSEQGRDE